ncbi:hypothetical protein F3Y22_tig00116937pilonHSYRG00119 [Hibiscus syriacus]|uniref:K-box domain-containing protein n=1 Tax=Hibiscus syriacus TaxID=106335 RepID=A0A6A2Y0V8_HIBSY|nr:hypothetical protein F3Y22_tig00116937pilonHSYRG00119 [Hibiscus syriacus]
MEDTVSRYNRGKAVDESVDEEKPELKLNPKPIDINTLKEEYLRLCSAYMRLNGKELEGVSFKELQQLEHQLNEGMLSVKEHKEQLLREQLKRAKLQKMQNLHNEKGCFEQSITVSETTQVWRKKGEKSTTLHAGTVGGLELMQEPGLHSANVQDEHQIIQKQNGKETDRVETQTEPRDTVATVEEELATTEPNNQFNLDFSSSMKGANVSAVEDAHATSDPSGGDQLNSVITLNRSQDANVKATDHVSTITNEQTTSKPAATTKDVEVNHSIPKRTQSITIKGSYMGSPLIITTIYGSNDGGDFNVILQSKESSNYDLMGPTLTPDMKYFQEVTQDLHFQDHPFFGPSFTWSNKQQNSFLAKKLDRVLINPTWNELSSLEEVEVMFLKQKAKVQWLKEGDKCTKFFHSIISSKNKIDNIQILINDQGRRLESFDEMAVEVTEFYSGLLGTVYPGVKNCDPNLLKDLMQFNLPPDYSSNLVNEVTGEEIKEAIFNQGNDKAPVPDGFTPYFFKKLWFMVGEDVIKAIKYFFQETFILPAFNATTIALVPNVHNPNKVRDFRLISYFSVIYKTIMKILLKRLTTLLPGIISPNQSAFVKGRNVVDNTLLAQELLPNTFIGWIETFFTEARYSFYFNGSLIGFFKGAWGIRQVTGINALDQFYELSGLKLNAANAK